MRELSDAIHDLLAADATISATVSTWNGGPAIFTRSEQAPGDAGYPFILADPAAEATRQLAIENDFRLTSRPVHVYAERRDDVSGERTADTGPVDDLAERVAEVLRAGPLVVTGHHVAGTRIDGPTGAPATDDAYHRVVTLTVWHEKE